MTTFNTGAYPPGCTQRDVDRAQQGDEPPYEPTREEQEGDAWEYWHERARALEAENAAMIDTFRALIAVHDRVNRGLNLPANSIVGEPAFITQARAHVAKAEGRPLPSTR